MNDHQPPDEETMFEDLEMRLRNLPRPVVPSGLEERLLASAVQVTVNRRPSRFGNRRLWLAGAAALAACLLLVVHAWLRDRPTELESGVAQNSPPVFRFEPEPMSMHLRWAVTDSAVAHDEYRDPAASQFVWPVQVAASEVHPRSWKDAWVD